MYALHGYFAQTDSPFVDGLSPLGLDVCNVFGVLGCPFFNESKIGLVWGRQVYNIDKGVVYLFDLFGGGLVGLFSESFDCFMHCW